MRSHGAKNESKEPVGGQMEMISDGNVTENIGIEQKVE